MKTSLFERLEKLRERPEEHRRLLTFWFSVGITGLVAVIWVASLSFTLQLPKSGASQMAAVGASDSEKSEQSQSSDFLANQKTNIIAGWKIITNKIRK